MLDLQHGKHESLTVIIIELLMLSALVILFRNHLILMLFALSALLAAYMLAYFNLFENKSVLSKSKVWLPRASYRVGLFLIGAIVSFGFANWYQVPKYFLPLIQMVVAMGILGNIAAFSKMRLLRPTRRPRLFLVASE
jgi:hypothetical protein